MKYTIPKKKYQDRDGLSNHKLYGVWLDIKKRCYWPKHKYYYRYGGRGIDVCPEWNLNAKSFIDWALQNGWQEGLTIDRINNDLGYYPWNCRCVSFVENSKNKCNSRVIEYNGKKMVITDWANYLGIPRITLTMRLNRGWSIEEAFTTPIKSRTDKRIRRAYANSL